MFARSSALAVATILAAAALSPTGALAARAAFDGSWSVQIATSRGACPSGVDFAVDVRDGVVSAAGLLTVSGNVTANGVTRVRIAAGNQSANGTGRLSGNSGSGTWQGVSAQGICAGRWSASRR
jgi:anaerobic selenocysteine-containing dehydrogenase